MEATGTNGSPRCPYTVTARRNPHRRARPTPSAAAPQPPSFSKSTLTSISSFPVNEILSIDVSENPNSLPTSTEDNGNNSFTESLKVFLRIKPLTTLNIASPKDRRNQNHRSKIKNTWPKAQISKESTKKKVKKKSNSCITINNFKSVTLSPPPVIQDSKRIKSEIYEGFSQVFAPESSQDEVYEKMVSPLVDDFLRGKSGMLAAIGPTGSGKTHTIFGSTREPGMVPQAIRRIFERSKEVDSDPSRRMFYFSMFEIYSERGKGEKLYDLSQEGGDLFMQKSTIKGLKEVVISDIAEAESFIACGMLKRTTAMTNANSQSSRSQCIISIRQAFKMENEVGIQQNDAVLTIVDLAGAERERKTGNQGERLLESNFINNTSMVFGLCLRSLLEHQKNPKKPLEKHFQNSLLTRYLRDYLEGKKRMALILTVKSGEEDYLDTSFLLRQASPYMNIKFNNVEESSNLLSNKRTTQALPRWEQQKRLKISKGKNAEDGSRIFTEDTSLGRINQVPPWKISVQSENATKVEVDEFAPDKSNLVDKERNDLIMKNFAKALWNVLKQYKKKLEVTESEAHDLRQKLKNETLRCLELERELKYSKTQCTCCKVVSAKPAVDDIIGWVGCSAEARVLSPGVKNLNQQINQNDENIYEISASAEESHDSYCFGIMDSNHIANRTDLKTPDLIDCSCESLSLARDDGECCAQLEGNWLHKEECKVEEQLDASARIINPTSLGSCASNGNNSDETKDPVRSSIKIRASSLGVKNVGQKIEQDVDQNGNTSIEFIGNAEGFRESNYSAIKDSKLDGLDTDHRCSDPLDKSSVVNSVPTCGSSRTCSLLERGGPQIEESMKCPDQLLLLKEEEPVEGCNTIRLTKPESEISSNTKTLGLQKQKRRLLPASSILLKDFSALDLDDESEKPKGRRGEKKLSADERKRTQGSLSLLRLLKSNLHI